MRKPKYALLLFLALLLAGGGCVETKRTVKGRYGAPTQYMSGERREFDANNIEPRRVESKPWYERILPW